MTKKQKEVSRKALKMTNKKRMIEMTNLQMIEIKYLAATNTKGARMKIIDTRFKASVTLNMVYSSDMQEQALVNEAVRND